MKRSHAIRYLVLTGLWSRYVARFDTVANKSGGVEADTAVGTANLYSPIRLSVLGSVQSVLAVRT